MFSFRLISLLGLVALASTSAAADSVQQQQIQQGPPCPYQNHGNGGGIVKVPPHHPDHPNHRHHHHHHFPHKKPKKHGHHGHDHGGGGGPPPEPTSSAKTHPPGGKPTHAHGGPPTSKPAPTSSGGGKVPPVQLNGWVHVNAGDAQSSPQAWLEAHNAYRRMYKAPDVKWSPEIAAVAQRHSDSCNWGHTKNGHYGENIAAGQRNISSVLHDWVNGPTEKGKYDPSDSGARTFSHFTQVVWAGTKEIGCSVRRCGSMRGLGSGFHNTPSWVCNYNPPGNVIGAFKNNVHARKGGAPT